MRTIEVTGVGFVNKGAQLMLIAIVQALAIRCPEVGIAVSPRVGSYRERARLGLLQKMREDDSSLARVWTAVAYRPRMRQRYGLVLDTEIGAVLDASGFSLGDTWGPAAAQKMAQKARRWKQQGKKVVLLPQAFGPFEHEPTRNAFRELMEHVDLAYARDADSLRHVLDVVGADSKVRKAPDFTGIVQGRLPQGFAAERKYACLIPNSNMLERSSGAVRESYVPFMERCARALAEEGVEPILLLHSKKGDTELAEAIAKRCDGAVRTVAEEDPVMLKGIIGGSHVVVGSRFHGLVNALSQGVPALATGWSHKYSRLFEEFGCRDLLVGEGASPEEILEKLPEILQGPPRERLVHRLKTAAEEQRQETRAMWKEVLGVINVPDSADSEEAPERPPRGPE